MYDKMEFLKNELSMKRKVYLALILALLAFAATVMSARAETPLGSYRGAKKAARITR